MEGPRILAGFVQGTLAAVCERDPEAGARVRARLAEATRERLKRASRIAWLPIEIDVELTDAVYAELGETRARELFRHNLSGALETPVLRSLAQGALRLFGASPARFFGWAPKAYGQLYRDAGEMHYGCEGAGLAWLTIEALPPQMAASASYLDGIAASIAAGLDLLGVKGEVRVEARGAGGRSVRFRIEWDEADDGDESIPLPVSA